MAAVVGEHRDTHPDLPGALDEVLGDPTRISAVFQPIVDVIRGEVCGWEALARFAGPVPAPTPWLLAAARCGRLGELEAVLLDCQLAARHRLPPNTFLSVNADPGTLGHPRVRAALRAAGDLRGVVVELTERTPVHLDDVHPELDQLRDQGASVALDDLGAGYAALGHLLDLQPDLIKLDRAMVGHLHADPVRRAIVESVSVIANRVDAWLVAEGVECDAEREVLRQLGVPLAQGWLFGRPGPDLCSDRPLAQPRETPEDLGALGGSVTLLDPVAAAELPACAAQRFAREPQLSFLAAVDPAGRPLGVVEREQPGRMHPPLMVLPTEPAALLAQRAVFRPRDLRWQPLVVIDEQGRYLGLLTMESVLQTMAGALCPMSPTPVEA